MVRAYIGCRVEDVGRTLATEDRRTRSTFYGFRVTRTLSDPDAYEP